MNCDSCNNLAAWESSIGELACQPCKDDYKGSEEQARDESKHGKITWRRLECHWCNHVVGKNGKCKNRSCSYYGTPDPVGRPL